MDLFWEKDGWQEQDKHLVALKLSPFRRSFPQISLDKGPALFIIRGPRQIGKSSCLKSILAAYPEPRKAFYLSCENIRDYRELSLILESLRTTRNLILLDEISFIKEWARSVKHEIDRGYQGTIIVTGSHAGDLRAGGDQMPGRFGAGRELILHPMGFLEFCQMREQAGWTNPDRLATLRMYFKTGGMPAAVIEAGEKADKPPESALDTYERWILGDAARSGKNQAFVRGLMGQIALTMGSGLSLQTLASKTEIASHHTVQEYIHFLEDAFALRTCYALDPDTGAARFRKQKKFYFTDPIIFWIAIRMSGLPSHNAWEEQIAEMVGYEYLAQRADSKHESLGYFTSEKGEIDYFAPKRWAIELKWSQVANNINPIFYSVPVPNRVVWTQNNFLSEI